MSFLVSFVRLAWVNACAWLFVLVALVFAVGCERQIAPPLIEITELTPREVESSDRLEIHGTGFPQGRTGHVTFEGSAFRPGEAPVHGLMIEADGMVITPDRLELVVREDLSERLCGRGDHAAHATFRGNVRVSFTSNTPGAPPLVGLLHATTLDVLPSSARASIVDGRIVEGGRVLSFLGITPAAPTARGLPIEQVRNGSQAERAGLLVGDVIASVDSVHVLNAGDVVPSSARTIELTIRHGDSGTEESKTLSMVEYSGDRVPTEYAPALVIVGVALAILVLLVLPGPMSLAVLEMRIASRARKKTFRELLAALFGTGRSAALSAIVSAVLSAFALMPWVIGREADGVVLFATGVSLLVWSRVARARGFVASLRVLAQSFAIVIAMAGAMALAIGQLGAIEIGEIVRAQGGAPWRFAAARHPACAVLAIVYSVAVVTILRARSQNANVSHSQILERGGVLIASALGVMTFFGGWQIPGVIFENATRVNAMLFASAGILIAKTWLFAAILFGAARIAASIEGRDIVRIALKRLLPALIVAGAFVLASRKIVIGAAVETAWGVTVITLVALFVIRVTARVRTAASRPEPHASPFL